MSFSKADLISSKVMYSILLKPAIRIHDSIQELAQFYGLLLTVKRDIARLVVSDEGWYLEITDEEIFERNVRAQIAMKNGALQKYCEDGFVVESFIDTYRKVFGTSEDLVYQQIYSRPFFYNANDLTETQFVRLANGEIPQKGIVDLTESFWAVVGHL